MSKLVRLTPGTTIRSLPAGTWNAFCDNVQRTFKQPTPGNNPGQSAGSNTLTCLVFNDTGDDIAADFPVLELKEPVYNTDDNEDIVWGSKAFNGTTPDGNTQINDIAIIQGPIAEDESRSAVIAGPTWVKVQFTDEGHSAAVPKSGDNTQLTSADSGIKIVWHEELPDAEYLPASVWALVILGGSPPTTKYELLRGTVTAVDPVLNVVSLSATPSQLPTGAKALPTGALKAFNRHGITINVSDEIYCVHDTACYDDTAGVNTHGVLDWSVLPFGGTDTTKTLLFKLYNNVKHRNDSSFEAKLCKADKTAYGDPVTIYDPFAGTNKGFSAGHHEDAVGRCTLERDADTGATRLVVTHLESIAQYVVGELGEDWGYTNSGEAKCSDYSAWGPDLQYLEPTEEIIIFGDDSLHGHLKAGDRFTAVLYDPDADDGGDPAEPRTAYVIVDHPGGQGRSLIAKLTTTVSAKDGDEFGTGTANLGHTVDGEWTMLEEDVEVLNPSNIPVNLPSGKSIHLPVDLINGEWVLSAPLELLSLAGWMAGIDQSIGHDADELPEWQADGDCDEEEEE